MRSDLEPFFIALRDRDRYVRRAATEALAQIKDYHAVEPLLLALKDEDSVVRRNATEALSKLHDPRAVQAFVKALTDSSELVRRVATEAIIDIGEPAIAPLIAVGNSESHRALVMDILAKIGASAVDYFIGTLSSPILETLGSMACSKLALLRSLL
jgi:FOG: HEAT repeat